MTRCQTALYGENISEGKEYEGLYSVDLGLSFSADGDNLKSDNPENFKVRCINIAEDGTCLIECIGKNQYFIKLSGGYAVHNNAVYAIKGYLLGSYKLSHYEDANNEKVLVEDPKQTEETLQKFHDSIETTKRSGYCGAMGNYWKRNNIEEIINGMIAAEEKQGLNSGSNN